MMIIGYAPANMGVSIFNSSVKNNIISPNFISNSKPISIMPVMSMIFEKCVGNIIDQFFKFHNNLYGLVNNGRCRKALFTFRRIVEKVAMFIVVLWK